MSTTQYLIRKFSISDYDALLKLWDKTKLSYRIKGRDSFLEIKRQNKLPCVNILIAESDNKLIGSIIGTHDDRRGWLNRLAVHPDFQRKDIAKRLVKETEKWLYQAGIKIICVLIEDWNKTSSQVFKKLGYTQHSDITYFSKRKNPEV